MEITKLIIFIVLFLLVAMIAFFSFNAWKGAGGEKDKAASVTLERNAVDNKYKWNLGDIYASRTDFDKDVESAKAQIKDFSNFSQRLTSDREIKSALDSYYSLSQKIGKISAYAGMFFDQDTRNTEGTELKKVAENLGADFGKVSAFLDPELLKLPKEKLEFLAAEAQFNDYKMAIMERLRYKDHILSDKEESLLAQSSIIQNAGYNIFDTFINGEMQFPEVTFSDGKKITLTQALFTEYRQNSNRNDRKLVFEKFFGTLNNYRNTFAKSLSSQVDSNIFVANARKFDSAVQAALFSENIPTAVYEKIIQKTNDNLPVLQRYLELKKKILGLDKMSYYDLYAPITNGLKDKYSYERSSQIVLDAMKPMGDEYLKIAAQAIVAGNGWVDAMPSKGKSNGGYSSDIYGVHPYILLNFTGNYDSVTTQAHELGHTMHSYFADANQPYSQAGYSIFAAEIASTFNENLLLEDRLNKETDKNKKVALLGESLETMRTTIFRQALFSEFEYNIYQAAGSGTPLTADFLSKVYLDLVKKYYGADKGIVDVGDLAGIEWAYVPHFYYDFYVYKYVSGYLAGLALSDKVFNGDNILRDAYIEKVLKNGGAKYPLEQLKDAGVDMADDKIYDEAFNIFQKRITQLEELVKIK